MRENPHIVLALVDSDMTQMRFAPRLCHGLPMPVLCPLRRVVRNEPRQGLELLLVRALQELHDGRTRLQRVVQAAPVRAVDDREVGKFRMRWKHRSRGKLAELWEG